MNQEHPDREIREVICETGSGQFPDPPSCQRRPKSAPRILSRKSRKDRKTLQGCRKRPNLSSPETEALRREARIRQAA